MSLAEYVPTAWTDYADSPDLEASFLNHIELGIDVVTDELIAFESWAAANYQPVSAELTAIASLSSPGYVKRTGPGTYVSVASIPQADVAGLAATLGSYLPLTAGPTKRLSGALYSGGLLTYIPEAPLNLVNSAQGAMKTQLNLVNSGGFPGAGSAIDFYTYDNSGGTLPGVRIGALDNNWSADFVVYTKAPGAAANALVERLRVANDGTTTISSLATGFVRSTSGVLSSSALVAADLPASGVTAGTYGSSTQVPVVVLDAKGRVTGVTTVGVSASSIAWSAVTGKPTTLAGYGIADATLQNAYLASPSGNTSYQIQINQTQGPLTFRPKPGDVTYIMLQAQDVDGNLRASINKDGEFYSNTLSAGQETYGTLSGGAFGLAGNGGRANITIVGAVEADTAGMAPHLYFAGTNGGVSTTGGGMMWQFNSTNGTDIWSWNNTAWVRKSTIQSTGTLKIIGGTSSQFLKADGSIDSAVYLTSAGSITGNAATSTLASNSSALGGVGSDYFVQGNGGGTLGHRTTTLVSATIGATQSGFFDSQTATDGPQGKVWTHVIRAQHSGGATTNDWSLDIAAPFGTTGGGTEAYYVRTISNGTTPGWRQLWHSGNLTSLNQLANGPGYISSAGSITGNASTATEAVNSTNLGGKNWDYFVQGSGASALGHRTTQVALFNTPSQSGFYDSLSAIDGPLGANWTYLIRAAHNGNSSGNQWMFDIAAGFGPAAGAGSLESYFMRTIASGIPTPWRTLWHSGNYTPGVYPSLAGGSTRLATISPSGVLGVTTAAYLPASNGVVTDVLSVASSGVASDALLKIQPSTIAMRTAVGSAFQRISSDGTNLVVNGTTGLPVGFKISGGIGCYGTTPPAGKPTVSGSRGSNAALVSLLTVLAAFGLIIDSTT